MKFRTIEPNLTQNYYKIFPNKQQISPCATNTVLRMQEMLDVRRETILLRSFRHF